MPFAVTQWALEPDPRAPDYIIAGWDVGQLSPWKWHLFTRGATGLLAIFNEGVTFHNNINTPTFGNFLPDPVLPDMLSVVFNIEGFQIPQVGPPNWTITIQINILRSTTTLYTSFFKLLYPVAIQIQGPIPMTEVDTTFGTIPFPMEISPVKWNG